MYAVIFRATVGELDQQYNEAIERMKSLAFEQYGCLEFFALMDGEDRVAISYWNTEEDIHNWKRNSEHLKAQAQGRDKWYKSYSVQVAEVQREYSHDS
jgi:heme-degrading monooxygenase HmoA